MKGEIKMGAVNRAIEDFKRVDIDGETMQHKGLGKQLHMFICANADEYKKLSHRLLNTNKFGVRSGFVSRSEVIPSLINGLNQARKGA